MAADLVKTKTPGVFKRGSRYAFIYRDAEGHQRQESARTYDDARRLRALRESEVAQGAYGPQSRARFESYALEWVERYQGTARRGFSEHTPREYRRDLKRYAIPQLGRKRLEAITPKTIADFLAWLCDEQKVGRRQSDASVRRILAPVRACLRTAMGEGLIRSNPTAGAVMPARDERQAIEEDRDELGEDDEVRALTDEQLSTLLMVAPAEHRTLFELLAATGLRISEAVALRAGDFTLDGERPVVRVRRRWREGSYGPPKSKPSRRTLPLEHSLVRALRRAMEGKGERDLVFPRTGNEPHHISNLRRDALKPAAGEAGVPWMGFHTFRHTLASRLFAAGYNIKQVQCWLGHSDPAFTLRTYVKLLNDDLGEPLPADPRVSAKVSAVPTSNGTTPTEQIASFAG